MSAAEHENQTPSYPTSLGTSTAEEISLMGQSLSDDLMGKVGFAELAFWMTATRRPAPGELRTFEAVLVALADHGFTPTAIAARLTYLSAPESIQGAIAAGLLGGGSRFLGVTEDTGRFLHQVLADDDGERSTDADYDALAREAITAARAARQIVPGLGHPVHKSGDPRTPRLIQIAEEGGTRGEHLRLFEAMGRVSEEVLGKKLPLNGAGVCGAALADLGLPVDFLRGFALLARTAGLLGQIAEERRNPIANDIYMHVDRNAKFVPLSTEAPEES
ncbi:citryl-CoA lyase [Nesterenkonia lutea]|uniref:citrate synthase (unknown stereospecificity) n=1 Tax=Nesterenkonia lutea TaxID=272919 RepID=A0ABR9JHL6_9MICC|nr:citryl-CoA lyase [Nesterenkonia lutea]MBE1525326.1 citrate synthase [Nesterenkonia lutea]